MFKSWKTRFDVVKHKFARPKNYNKWLTQKIQNTYPKFFSRGFVYQF
jgi:Leu/Phe-tRNA-protein transferase